ncbi:MAG TPA: SBBP repeat-containing protein [Candidatus Xenobia bacterium]|nr:SBBP repeat-containing protein [Candidatus Xenobia bacterium]
MNPKGAKQASFVPAVVGLSLALLWTAQIAAEERQDSAPQSLAVAQVPSAGVKTLPARRLIFEPNYGQVDGQAKFLARGRGYTLFLTASDFVVALPSIRKRGPDIEIPEVVQPGAALRLKLRGANRDARLEGLDALPGRSNYFSGSDPTQWRTNIPQFARVRYEAIYPGIDLVFYGSDQGPLEFDFVVAPGADPAVIEFDVEGAEQLQLTPEGDAVARLAGRALHLRRPLVYQGADGVRQEIAAAYRLADNKRVSFSVSDYDPARPLVIDPAILTYSTYFGGAGNVFQTGDERALGIALDGAGNIYVTGWTESDDFPTTMGAFDTEFDATDQVVFVSKFNNAGSVLLYSTFLDSGGADTGAAIAVDSSGNAYVTGHAFGPSFPTTMGAFDTTPNGGLGDAFVTKLGPNGDSLVYSTVIGGSGGSSKDLGMGIAIDPDGNAYITGFTNAGNFPTTMGAFDTVCGTDGACGGGFFTGDAFVTKLNPSGTDLVWSTFLGGGDAENFGGGAQGSEFRGIAVDADRNVYVTGDTRSTDFPTTPGAFDTVLNTPPFTLSDVFVTKLNSTGTGLVFSTYVGGNNDDGGLALAIDSANPPNVYVTGFTGSGFPLVNAVDTSANGCSASGFGCNAFVFKMNGTGTAPLVYSTYLSGNEPEQGTGIAVAADGSAYVTGFTFSSTGFPNFGSFQAFGGNVDAFVAKFDPTGAPLTYLTFLGGAFGEIASDIAVDNAGTAYVAGYTGGDDFPTVLPFQGNPAFGLDTFIAKVDFNANNPVPAISNLSPATALVGGAAFTLKVEGSNFVSNSVVRFDGVNRTTNFFNFRRLDVPIAASELTAPDTVDVTVFNPAPVGGLSNTAQFVIQNGNFPIPSITSTNPTSAFSGGGNLLLTVNGSDFVANSVLRWNGSDRSTTVVNVNQLTATILSSDTADGQVAQLTVFNPAPGGGESAPFPFTVNNFPPFLNTVSPTTVGAGGDNFTLTANGSFFVPSSVVRWNDADRQTTFVSSNQLKATILASDVASAGSGAVTVFSPAPGGGTSSSKTVTISATMPDINTNGAVNAASFAPGVGVAAGSITAVFGVNLASSTAIAGSLPLPTTLGGATMQFNTNVNVPKFFASASQVNIQVPWSLAGQSSASLTDTVNGLTSPAESVSLATFAPGLFSTSQNGMGQGAILIANTPNLAAPMDMFPGSRPAVRGVDFLEIYWTGGGPVTNQPATGAAASANPLSVTTTTPTLTIGGVATPVLFSGLAPGFVGLYVVTCQVQAGTPVGDAVPVVLTIGGVQSNTVTIAISQ